MILVYRNGSRYSVNMNPSLVEMGMYYMQIANEALYNIEMKILQETINKKFHRQFVYGTAGEGKHLEGIEEIFKDPEKFKVVPYESKVEKESSSSRKEEGSNRMEFTVNGQKMWFDYDRWKAEKEFMDKLEGKK